MEFRRLGVVKMAEVDDITQVLRAAGTLWAVVKHGQAVAVFESRGRAEDYADYLATIGEHAEVVKIQKS